MSNFTEGFAVWGLFHLHYKHFIYSSTNLQIIMQTLAAFIQKIAGYKVLISLVLCFGVFSNLLLPQAERHINQLSGAEVGVLDLKSGLHPNEVYTTVSQYTPDALNFYRLTELTADVVYPIIYTLLFAVALYLVFVGGGVKAPFTNAYLLPFATMFIDYLENIFIVSILSFYPTQITALAYACSAATLLKWVFLTLNILLLLYGLMLLAIKRTRKNTSPDQ